MTNQHRKTERPSDKDLKQNPGIGASKGTIKGGDVLDEEGLDGDDTSKATSRMTARDKEASTRIRPGAQTSDRSLI